MKIKHKFEIWDFFTFIIFILFSIFLIYPVFNLLFKSIYNENVGFTLEYFIKFFNHSYYFETLKNSLFISTIATFCTATIGITLAYIFSMYKIKGYGFLKICIIISSMSAPFVGAYSWILLLGRNGVITKFLNNINIPFTSIYGFYGILLVFTCQLYPLIFLYAESAFSNMDNSLMEASENLGVNGLKRFFKIILPIALPSILASMLLVFMRCLADFGTPMLIGEGYRTFPQLIYTEFVGEVGTNAGFASAISVIAIIFTTIVFLIQKKISESNSYSTNFLNPIIKKQANGLLNILIHIFSYIIIFISILPQIYLAITSFKNTSGMIFVDGYSFNNYKAAFERMGTSILNTTFLPIIALIIIIILSIITSYLIVRCKNTFNQIIDIFIMIPYIVPGIVIGIALLNGFSNGIFNSKFLNITSTSIIVIVSFVIRRLPYTVRASVSTLLNIPISVEEAARSLGCTRLKSFFKVTIHMMSNGIIAGAILSYVTLISELSTSILLTNLKTKTMTVAIYEQVIKGNYGIAAALATLLTIFTIIALSIFMIITKKQNQKFN